MLPGEPPAAAAATATAASQWCHLVGTTPVHNSSEAKRPPAMLATQERVALHLDAQI
jgi:hypothetical protein